LNKQQYKKLLQLRKSEEMMFFELIKMGKTIDLTARDIIERIPINNKRAYYLLEKWCSKGRYEYGTSLDLGWVIEK
jgi:hypothetical protein